MAVLNYSLFKTRAKELFCWQLKAVSRALASLAPASNFPYAFCCARLLRVFSIKSQHFLKTVKLSQISDRNVLSNDKHGLLVKKRLVRIEKRKSKNPGVKCSEFLPWKSREVDSTPARAGTPSR